MEPPPVYFMQTSHGFHPSKHTNATKPTLEVYTPTTPLARLSGKEEPVVLNTWYRVSTDSVSLYSAVTLSLDWKETKNKNWVDSSSTSYCGN